MAFIKLQPHNQFTFTLINKIRPKDKPLEKKDELIFKYICSFDFHVLI